MPPLSSTLSIWCMCTLYLSSSGGAGYRCNYARSTSVEIVSQPHLALSNTGLALEERAVAQGKIGSSTSSESLEMSELNIEELGATLVTKEGVKPTGEVLQGKRLLAIYFSAHWCPPCRGFTPVLAEFYSQLKEEDAAALEVVFVSSDRDAHEFGEYFGSQPWVSMAFENAAARQALGQKFGVRGIPTLIVLDLATGKVRDSDGRSTVAQARGDTSKALAKWE